MGFDQIIKKYDYRKEGSYYIVWVEESNFIELDETSFNILNQLSQGISPEKIMQEYEAEYYEPLELDVFIESLRELGFIGETEKEKKSTLSFIKPENVSWLYSKPAMALYLAIISLGLALLVLNPGYFPVYSDYFISDSYFTTLTLTFIIGIIFLSIHELSHLLSARARGVYGSIGVGLRLYFPVAETNITGLWKLVRNKRYLPLLAGMLSDTLIASIGIVILYSQDHAIINIPSIYIELIKASILILWYGLIWQFMLFMKTDLYYILSNKLGVRNLFEESWKYLINQTNKLLGRRLFEQSFPERDRKIIKLYSLIVLVFSAYSVSVYTLYGVPIFSRIIIDSVENILAGSASLIENLFVLFFTGLQLSAFLYFIGKSVIQFFKE
jgi:hypothetical protein